MMKVVRMTVKTTVFMTVKMLFSTTPKKTRKKSHWSTKANRCCRNHQRVLRTSQWKMSRKYKKKTTMKMMTEPVLRTLMAMVELKIILTQK